jgi:hypothetical protein
MNFSNSSSGIMTYTAINGLAYIIKLVSFGRIVPVDEDYKEYWTCKQPFHSEYLMILTILQTNPVTAAILGLFVLLKVIVVSGMPSPNMTRNLMH